MKCRGECSKYADNFGRENKKPALLCAFTFSVLMYNKITAVPCLIVTKSYITTTRKFYDKLAQI